MGACYHMPIQILVYMAVDAQQTQNICITDYTTLARRLALADRRDPPSEKI